MDDGSRQSKGEVAQQLQEVDAAAQSIEKLGKDLIRSARQTRDVVAPLRSILDVFPTESIERIGADFQAWRRAADQVLEVRKPSPTL